MTETTRMTFGDMFRNSFLNMFPETIDPWSLVTVLAVSLLLGLGIFLVYRHCFIGVVYDHSFNISLVVMTILTAVIIVTISSNVMLSLGMVGALSIVRYRTAVKSPMDLMFLFWAITTGIAVGATYYYIAALAFLFVAVTFAALRQLQSSDHTYMLVVNYDPATHADEEVRRRLAKHKNSVRSKIIRGDSAELTIEVILKNDNVNLADSVSSVKGVRDVTLVQYRGSYET
ncbi:MAG TPA: DUF4956 domain-containing protein [Candidatus Faecalibacterium avium]|uniref:DUF4956 domain-containing protein n=1 Tax=Faecalibacterium sp. An121 TaxID=1965550 RepID=UPI000B378354|nr:DUF4956 domain-containing protein [Faecalibacterium sp. An121]OUQ37125.1 hypothetical protein B5E66_09365 [Faecalibacterium sp. An121]HIV42905.1 DUF4956 domain-containing protein [Candidatus Faecalibacterium avium]